MGKILAVCTCPAGSWGQATTVLPLSSGHQAGGHNSVRDTPNPVTENRDCNPLGDNLSPCLGRPRQGEGPASSQATIQYIPLSADGRADVIRPKWAHRAGAPSQFPPAHPIVRGTLSSFPIFPNLCWYFPASSRPPPEMKNKLYDLRDCTNELNALTFTFKASTAQCKNEC